MSKDWTIVHGDQPPMSPARLWQEVYVAYLASGRTMGARGAAESALITANHAVEQYLAVRAQWEGNGQ